MTGHTAAGRSARPRGRGRTSSVKIPDLLIAAVAERNRVTILHDDRDFDVIAEVPGQPCEWVVPHGSAP